MAIIDTLQDLMELPRVHGVKLEEVHEQYDGPIRGIVSRGEEKHIFLFFAEDPTSSERVMSLHPMPEGFNPDFHDDWPFEMYQEAYPATGYCLESDVQR